MVEKARLALPVGEGRVSFACDVRVQTASRTGNFLHFSLVDLYKALAKTNAQPYFQWRGKRWPAWQHMMDSLEIGDNHLLPLSNSKADHKCEFLFAGISSMGTPCAASHVVKRPQAEWSSGGPCRCCTMHVVGSDEQSRRCLLSCIHRRHPGDQCDRGSWNRHGGDAILQWWSLVHQGHRVHTVESQDLFPGVAI